MGCLCERDKEQTMSQVRMDSEDVVKIRNALTVIQGDTENIRWRHPATCKRVVEQVKRIDKLLPDVKKDRIVGSGIV